MRAPVVFERGKTDCYIARWDFGIPARGVMCTTGTRWSLALLVTALSLTSWAAEPAKTANESTVLIALENEWIEALQKSDTQSLSKVFAASFVDTDETGHRSSKAAVLDALGSGALKIRKLQLSDMKVYLYGDAAVVTGASSQDGTYEGSPLAPRIVFTDTFIRKGGAWQAVASQRTKTE
jgi:ketosteroid isomerase-like protein